jgi:hypothetical protein
VIHAVSGLYKSPESGMLFASPPSTARKAKQFDTAGEDV